MASPQTENGFTRVANEIIEALAQIQLTGHEWRCLMVLFRQTYGYQRKAHTISLSTWEKMTGLNRWRINETLKRLEERHVITILRPGKGRGYISTYSFQKDYNQWNGTEKRTDNNGTEKRTDKSKKGTENRTRKGTENRTHKRKKKEMHVTPTEKQIENQNMFSAIAEVCGIDWHVASEDKKGQINQSGGKLRQGNYTAADILSFGEWWFEHDWRGQKGQRPTPVQIRDEIGKWKGDSAGKAVLR